MGMGKSSGGSTTTVQMTPEQQETLRIQNDALKNTFLPAYQNTVGGAGNVYNQIAGNVGSAAQNASNVAAQTGQLQQNAGNLALQSGMFGQNNLANQLQGTGQGMTAAGQGTAGSIAQDQNVIGNKMQTFGGAGAGNTASYQNMLGQALTSGGAGQLAQLFSPQYKNEQIQASLQPAREEIREQLGGQNAMFGGAGGLGSSRMALANQNLAQLGQQRLQSAAAQTSAAVEAQRQNAANTLLGAGQTATTGAGNLYSTLLGGGQGAIGQANTAAGNLMNYGQGASGLSAGLYGNLANQGLSNITGANQAAASRIGYAGAPQDLFSKYAGIVFGTPQASTNPNYAGTQGSTSSGKSSSFKI